MGFYLQRQLQEVACRIQLVTFSLYTGHVDGSQLLAFWDHDLLDAFSLKTAPASLSPSNCELIPFSI